jgi:hypothetical protein
MATAQQWMESATSATAIEATCHRGGVEVLERWADKWREICDDATDDQPFYRPEWIAAHVRSFAPKAKIVLITVVADGQLQLILPLLEERAWFNGLPVRRLRAPVNGHSCRFDALRRRGAEGDRAIEHAWNCLKNLPGWDLLEFEGVPAEGTASAMADVAKQDGFLTGQITMSPNPYIRIPAGAAALGELPINKKLRSQMRGIRRELAESRGATTAGMHRRPRCAATFLCYRGRRMEGRGRNGDCLRGKLSPILRSDFPLGRERRSAQHLFA